MDVVREVTADEEARLQAPSQKAQATFVVEMTASLEKAILYFIASCAARRARGCPRRRLSIAQGTIRLMVDQRQVSVVWRFVVAYHSSLPTTLKPAAIVSTKHSLSFVVVRRFRRLTLLSLVQQHVPFRQ